MRRNYGATRAGGFTLTELLVVMVIIVLLASLVATNAPKWVEQGRITKAKSDVSQLDAAIRQYMVHCQDPPSQSDGLQALMTKPGGEHADRWQGPYLTREVPKDGWGRDYQYKQPGRHNADFDVYSFGKDGKEGTEDDIGNWGPAEKT